MTTLPGSKASHSIISDECRTNHGDDEALHVALVQLTRVYQQIAEGWRVGMNVKIHIAMTVERPERPTEENDAPNV